MIPRIHFEEFQFDAMFESNNFAPSCYKNSKLDSPLESRNFASKLLIT